ncbi:unnamed protein product [Leuciscus chuanchicus]
MDGQKGVGQNQYGPESVGWDDSVTGNCSQFDSCDGCISGDPALNLTRCVWQSCNDEDPSDGHAIRATESELRNNPQQMVGPPTVEAKVRHFTFSG